MWDPSSWMCDREASGTVFFRNILPIVTSKVVKNEKNEDRLTGFSEVKTLLKIICLGLPKWTTPKNIFFK